MKKLNQYLKDDDKASDGGIVDLGEYGKEVKQDEGFNHGPSPVEDLLQKGKDFFGVGTPPNLQTTYGQPKQPENLIKNYPKQAKVIGGARMAEGGIVEDEDRPEDSSYKPKALDLGDLPQNQAPIAGPDFKAPQIAPQAQKQPIQQAQPPAQPPPQLPGMPPGTNPDEIAQYIQGQKAQIGKYGPEQQMELQRQLIQQKNGLGNRLVSGAKGFSDALMQGVARAGNPGNQEAFENKLNEQGQQQTGALERAGSQNMQQVEAGQHLDMQDPKSPTSKAYQSSFAPVFQQMGIPASKVAGMSAAQISTVAEISSKTLDYRMQMQMKQAMLDVQKLTAQANIQNAKTERVMGAAKGQSDLGLFGGLLHPEAAKTYENILKGTGAAAGGAAGEFNYDAIPTGSTYTAPDGSKRTKK